MPYQGIENVLKGKCQTWSKAYLSQKVLIDPIECNFIAQTRKTWGNIGVASEIIASRLEC